MSAVRVLVVDDDDLMRAGLLAVLSSDDTLCVVGEACNGREAVTATVELDPDIVLMDLRMPTVDGISATREIADSSSQARVLILTTFEDDEYVFGALKAGAAGFLLKRTRPEDLIAAIHTVADGDSLLSPSVTRTVIDKMVHESVADPVHARRLRDLTPRERDVLELVAQGLSNAETARALMVEESTVKTHMKSILAKLHLRSRVHAVILSYESGLIQPGRGSATAPP